METCSKLDQIFQTRHFLDYLPHNLQTKHVQSLLFSFIRLTTFLIAIFMEAFIFLYNLNLISHLLPLSCLFAFFAFERFLTRSHGTYLVDFSCFKPPSFCRVPSSTFIEHTSMFECFNKESVSFMSKIIASSGQGEETYLPPVLHYIPPRTHHQESINEAQMVLFPAMDDLLSKTKISPHDIDILIVNCSAFCPSPSLSSIVINRYSMRSDIKSFNLSGMGCSASAIGVDLANNLLKIHKNSFAIVLSTEIVSTGWYPGNDRSKLLLNCVFRMGSAAILLTNKKEAKCRSKYKLLRSIRTQRAFDDKGYMSAMREEDSKGITGVSLKRDLLEVAGETLRSNAWVLGASILPVSEKLRYGLSVLRKRFGDPSKEVYMPDFRSAIEHYCLPTSGMAVIREIGKGLKLEEGEMEAAMMTLHRFGNQSSASMWYELAYTEAKGKVKKRHKVWQLGMGTGPKASSVVWECERDLGGEFNKGPWFDCIHRYPIITTATNL
ncbi:3-ketoacyl-CoA synthase 5-like [Macadamia integrifolia]|uniref:3-ketoacyl-CoA synthase 5-like n=1 Tax=Macadamia integrifolia TaxID=60698 RepID=UPI001C4F09CB|nr:3-ketoacyl-CoA synthase 5-like [Macadamia integrifolia]